MSQAKPRLQKQCLQCGGEFLVRASPSRAGRGKFCSQECSGRFQKTKHGHTTHDAQSPTYTSYMAMLGRCYRPGHPKFGTYGAIGIGVCDRWRESFTNFLADMGERPDGCSIDRFPDGAGNYEPGNCRWATPREQQTNINSNVFVEFDGRRMILSDWGRESGISPSVITYRLRVGWPIEKALTYKPWGRQAKA